jgi:predicted signal transduction protein with EAL and GGDEF domain
MGGDEFTILLSHIASDADACCIAERIVEAVQLPVQLGQEAVCIGASLGISVFPEHGADADVLQKHADLAMYQAKEGGRGQYRLFGPEMLAQGGDHLSLRVKLDSALKNDEFKLFHQPIVNLANGRTESVEALIRWQRSCGEMASPARFIPHAEQTGFIKKIDRWVLERACRDAMSWLRDTGRELRVCINLSAVSMQLPNMAKIIADVLQRSQLPPHLLTVEITETAVISDPVTVRKVPDEIAALGVGFLARAAIPAARRNGLCRSESPVATANSPQPRRPSLLRPIHRTSLQRAVN